MNKQIEVEAMKCLNETIKAHLRFSLYFKQLFILDEDIPEFKKTFKNKLKRIIKKANNV